MRSATTTSGAADSVQHVPLLAAFFHRNFRYLWFAFVCSSFVQRMDGVVLGWLVLEMTNSPFLVGLIAAVRFLGSFLGPLTGTVVDRVDRRRLNIGVLAVRCGVIGVLIILMALRRLEVWHLFAATIANGIFWAFFQPAQQSMQADILRGPELANGIALNNLAMNLTGVVGPVLGGMLLACCRPALRVWDWSEADMVLRLNWSRFRPDQWYVTTSQGRVLTSGDYGLTWGPAPFGLPDAVARNLGLEGAAAGVLWVYVALLGLNALQLVSYVAIRLQDEQRRQPSRAPIWQNLCEGWRYVWTDAGLATALIIAGLVNLAAFPLQFNLLPIFARDVFSVGAAGLGLLVAALGVGALLGSFGMVTFGSTSYAGPLMLFGTLVWCGFLLVFAFTPNFHFALGILVLIGVVQAVCMTNITIMLLGRGSSEMRGRVMGIRSLAVAPLFFGSMLSGAAAAEVGAPLTTVVCAVVGIIIVLCVAPWVPKGR